MPLPDDVRKGMDSESPTSQQLPAMRAGRHAAGRRVPVGVRRPTGPARGRTSTSPGRRSTPGEPTGYWPRAAPACRSGPCWNVIWRRSPPRAERRPRYRCRRRGTVSRMPVTRSACRRVLRALQSRMRRGIADERDVVDRDAQAVGPAAGLRSAGHPAPGPLAVVRDQHDRGLRHGRARLDVRLDAGRVATNSLQVVAIGRDGLRARRRASRTSLPAEPRHGAALHTYEPRSATYVSRLVTRSIGSCRTPPDVSLHTSRRPRRAIEWTDVGRAP